MTLNNLTVQPPPPPAFINIGGRILNTSQIKWVGEKDEKVYVEFITGGWTVLEEGVTLGDLHAALHNQ